MLAIFDFFGCHLHFENTHKKLCIFFGFIISDHAGWFSLLMQKFHRLSLRCGFFLSVPFCAQFDVLSTAIRLGRHMGLVC